MDRYEVWSDFHQLCDFFHSISSTSLWFTSEELDDESVEDGRLFGYTPCQTDINWPHKDEPIEEITLSGYASKQMTEQK